MWVVVSCCISVVSSFRYDILSIAIMIRSDFIYALFSRVSQTFSATKIDIEMADGAPRPRHMHRVEIQEKWRLAMPFRQVSHLEITIIQAGGGRGGLRKGAILSCLSGKSESTHLLPKIPIDDCLARKFKIKWESWCHAQNKAYSRKTLQIQPLPPSRVSLPEFKFGETIQAEMET